MNKELSPLEVAKQLKDFVFELELGNADKHFVNGSFDIIETALKRNKKLEKALKIIKDICKLKVYKHKLGQCFLDGTDILFAIPQETYELLKEVLLWKILMWELVYTHSR